MRRPRASAAPSIAGRSRPASERRHRRRHQFHDQCGEFDHPHDGGGGFAVAQVETAGLGFLWWTTFRLVGDGAGCVLGFISARASSDWGAGVFSATTGAGGVPAGGGGGTIVGMEVSITTLSGHLRAE
jgi:hypothetical protein